MQGEECGSSLVDRVGVLVKKERERQKLAWLEFQMGLIIKEMPGDEAGVFGCDKKLHQGVCFTSCY